MSGFWSIEEVENAEALWEEGEAAGFSMRPTRETSGGNVQHLDSITSILIWLLPFVHIEKITSENFEDTFIQIRMLELARGPFLSEFGDERWITLEFIKRRIGLRVVSGFRMDPLEVTLIGGLRSRAQIALNEAKACS
jgi:hypothetical protein